ncbi:MAG: cellulase family glycosylhydrolase [Janthinobacterium lividum]
MPVPGGALDSQVVSQIKQIIEKDRQGGAVTVIDPHGYGFMNKDGRPRDILQDAQARADYVDMMGKIGTAFQSDGVAIGLMNESHTGPDEAYASVWNDAIAAIRKGGYHGVVLVPHAHWSAAHDISPETPYSGRVVYPDHRWILELHSYLDPDGTGTYRKPVASLTDGAQRLAGAIAWSRKTGIKIFLGETGGPPDPTGVAAFSQLLEAVRSAPDVFWGIAVWGAGPWWKPNYPMRLDPVDNVPRPQFSALEYMLAPETLFLAKETGQPDQKVGLIVDGRALLEPVIVSAERTGPPQRIPVRLPLAPGVHQVRIVPKDGRSLYLLGAEWKGASNCKEAFDQIKPEGYVIRIIVPKQN